MAGRSGGPMRAVEFIRQVGLVCIVVLVLAAYPIYAYTGAASLKGVLAGCGIAALNVLAGCLAAVWAFEKPQKVFLKTVLGGMLIRLIGVGLAFLLLIRYTSVDTLVLTLSLISFFALFQVLEIRFLATRLFSRPSEEGR